MYKKSIIVLLILLFLASYFSGCIKEDTLVNEKPQVDIINPKNKDIVVGTVDIYGTVLDLNDNVEKVEVIIDEESCFQAEGDVNWSFVWNTYGFINGPHSIAVRSYNGIDYSDIEEILVYVDNPVDVESGSHKWAVFVAAANFPEDNESKLGNGGLYLAENMSSYLIEDCGYATSNIILLFDDGWIRNDNGLGKPVQKINNRPHEYNITYGSASKENVVTSLNYIIEQSNRYDDSEVFIWIFNHGYGDYSKNMTGGKILENSAVFVWDGVIFDAEIGNILDPLKSNKVCLIVDACYSGGFADRVIYNIPTLIKSGIPKDGRVIITGESKFRPGYASPMYGPLFSLIWFDGIITGNADGFRQGILKTGNFPRLMVKDGYVSVEEAFYYARWFLQNDKNLNDSNGIEPQINDQFPKRGFVRSWSGLILGE